MISPLLEVDRRTPFPNLSRLRLVVGGGRDYTNRSRLFQMLTDIHLLREIALIIHGACHLGGADKIAGDWAEMHGIPAEPCPVDHTKDGMWPGAGPRRNHRMLLTLRPTAVLVFPGGAGSKSLYDLAGKLNLPRYQVR
jgi:hypothetical protein